MKKLTVKFLLTITFVLMLPLFSCGGATDSVKNSGQMINQPIASGAKASDGEKDFNINGKWNIRGGKLDFDVQIIHSGSRLQWWSLSRYGNGDSQVEVQSFSIRGNNIKIILNQDVGIGPTTYTYNLTVLNPSLMKGTMKSYTGGWAGLPPISSINEVSVRRI